MKQVVLTYGLIAGLILGSSFFILQLFFTPEASAASEIVGYAIMIGCLSLIFFGIRRYRNKILAGAISIKAGFLCGLYISIIASVLYALGWVLYFNTVGDSGMMDAYYTQQIEQVEASAENPEDASRQVEQIRKMRDAYYNNNLLVFGLTLLEIFPLALVITIISALILKRKPKYAGL